MEQSQIAETKPEITIGVLGQDGHGKTSLTTAIAQTLARQNGILVEGGEIVIDPGNCRENGKYSFLCETETRRYNVVDCHRYADMIKNLILNWIPLHGAILVVSAQEGITAQTKEQLRLASVVGIAFLVVFLNKCDLVQDSELLALAEQEIRECVTVYGYPGYISIIRGSATASLMNLETDGFDHGNSEVADLIDAMEAMIPAPPRLADQTFLMCIEDVYAIETKGTIVVGRVERGTYHLNSRVEIVGLGPTRLTSGISLEQFHKLCATIYPGADAGMMVRAVKRGEAQPGRVVATPGTIRAYILFRAELLLATWKVRPIRQKSLSATPLTFLIRSARVTGTIALDAETVPEGREDTVQVTVALEVPVALERGLRFAVRRGGDSIAFGVVTEMLA